MENITISDGVIEQLISVAGRLEIIFNDWRENKWRLLIDEVVAFESIGAEGTEIGELIIEECNAYKKKVLGILPEEPGNNLSVYVFKSAWTGISALQVLGVNLTAQLI